MNPPFYNRFAVVDVETTGFSKQDRVLEIGLVILNSKTYEIVDEYETLINPERDVGPTDIHRISADMVSSAPIFKEVVEAISKRMEGAVLVSHNLPFDKRMICQEYYRLDIPMNPGQGVCTLNLTGEKLFLAAERYGLDCSEHHRALADARVSAELLKRCFEHGGEGISPVQIKWEELEPSYRTHPRDFVPTANETSNESPFQRLSKGVRYPSSREKVLSYLDTLNWALADLVITEKERQVLDELVEDLELNSAQIDAIHTSYLESLVAAALRDGIITTQEHELMNKVADLLHISEVNIPDITECVSGSLEPGTRICFTGTAVDANGQKIEREKLEALAARKGLQPVSSVTKGKCDMVVAADTSSSSNKVTAARKYDKPVMSVADFLDECG